jgi:hypothetical protein
MVDNYRNILADCQWIQHCTSKQKVEVQISSDFSSHRLDKHLVCWSISCSSRFPTSTTSVIACWVSVPNPSSFLSLFRGRVRRVFLQTVESAMTRNRFLLCPNYPAARWIRRCLCCNLQARFALGPRLQIVLVQKYSIAKLTRPVDSADPQCTCHDRKEPRSSRSNRLRMKTFHRSWSLPPLNGFTYLRLLIYKNGVFCSNDIFHKKRSFFLPFFIFILFKFFIRTMFSQ